MEPQLADKMVAHSAYVLVVLMAVHLVAHWASLLVVLMAVLMVFLLVAHSALKMVGQKELN